MSAILHVRAIRQTACLVVAAWVISSFAAAQEKKVKPPVTGPPLPVWPPAEKKILDDRKLAVEKIMTAGAIAPGDENVLREYFGTRVKGFAIKEVVPGLWQNRQIMRQHAIAAGNAPTNAAQIWLRQFLFTEMQKIVAEAKLPMDSRVNALGVIGDLNEKEPEVKNLNLAAPPVPLVAATPYLLQLFDAAATPSPLRATSLRGLRRHAEFGVSPAHQPALLASMLKAVQDATVPKECSPAAHEFLRSRAVQILGYLKDPSAAKPLLDVLNDAQASLGFRCDAARSLGMLTLKPGDGVAGTAAVAQTLGELAATVAETEVEQRALHEYLDCVRVGLNGDPKVAGSIGIRAATPQADAKLAGALVALIDPFVKNTEATNPRYRDKAELLAEDAATLAQGLRNALPAAAPAKAKEVKAPEPTKAKGEKAEPKKADPKTAEPPKAEPAKTEPAKAVPAKAEPAKASGAKAP